MKETTLGVKIGVLAFQGVYSTFYSTVYSFAIPDHALTIKKIANSPSELHKGINLTEVQ